MLVNIREVAEAALERLSGQDRRQVYAARPGIVCGALGVVPHHAVAFRRKGGRVRLELWDTSGGAGRFQDLPPDLQARAGAYLDSL